MEGYYDEHRNYLVNRNITYNDYINRLNWGEKYIISNKLFRTYYDSDDEFYNNENNIRKIMINKFDPDIY